MAINRATSPEATEEMQIDAIEEICDERGGSDLDFIRVHLTPIETP
jgi:hypothetical protein